MRIVGAGHLAGSNRTSEVPADFPVDYCFVFRIAYFMLV